MKRPVVLLLVLALASAVGAPLASQPLAAGPKIPVFATDSEKGSQPKVAAGAQGGFLVVWRPSGGKLAVRALDASGTPTGPTRILFDTTPAGSPENWALDSYAVAALPSGKYVVGWKETGNVDTTFFLFTFLAFFDANGEPAGEDYANFQVYGLDTITALPDGGFVMLRQNLAQRYSDSGEAQTPILELPVVPLPGTESQVAVRPDGGFVAVNVLQRNQRQDVVFRLFAPDGTPRGPETLLHEPDTTRQRSGASVFSGASGHFVVTWAESGPAPGDVRRLKVRLFGPDGQALTPEITVASPTGNLLAGVPRAAVRPDGTFLVLAGLESATLARVYGPDGRPAGDDLFLEPSEAASKIAVTPGGWALAWSQALTDGPWFRLLDTACAGNGEPGLCLNGNRFRATVTWRVPSTGAEGTGAEGIGTPIPLTDDTGAFWFFQPSNYELAVKVLDGRGVNGHFWVFYGSLTNVEFDLTVTDAVTGEQRTYHNPAGTMASQADTEAFPQ